MMGDLNLRWEARASGEEDVLGPHIWGRGFAQLAQNERAFTFTDNRARWLAWCR